MSVYLAGPINGCDDEAAKRWRHLAADRLGDVIDPMTRDYRDVDPRDIADLVVFEDKADIEAAEMVLAFCPFPSVGTSMEILYAYDRGKPVVVVVPDWAPLSPWLAYHATFLRTDLDAGIQLAEEILRALHRNAL